MSILTQLKQNFDNFLKNNFSVSDNYCLKLISKLLEECDLELAATRDKSLEIVKKVSRTILTSKGPITFKRRYYYNTKENTYTYLLDPFLRIPKYSRLSNELKIKILSSLDHLSYEAAGKDNLPKGCEISAVSVFNLLNKSTIEVEYKPFKVSNKVIHVQIDEKYISMKSKRKKASNRRVYTACIFTDINKVNKNRHFLVNRTIISARSLNKFFQRINATLVKIYGVKENDKIYISGDLATYIQNSPEKITVCNAYYISDKFHVQNLAKKYLGFKIDIDDLSCFDSYIEAYIDALEQIDKYYMDKSYYTLYTLLKENPDAIRRWFNKDYLGCSQECINSHYFANRLDKKPNTFTTASCDKLCDLINAIHNNLSFKINTHESYYDIPIQCCLPSYSQLVNEKTDCYIDYNSYSYGVRNTLKAISGLKI